MIEYKIYSNATAPEALYRFRYSIYVEEMRRKQRYANHHSKTIRDPLDELGHQGIAFNGQEIIGCIRMNFLRDGDIGEYLRFYELDLLQPEDANMASICTRLMIARAARHTQVSIDLIKFAYEFGLRNGIKTCYIDCNRHLVSFFERFGWKKLFRKEHVEYGMVDVLRLDLCDFDQLQRINSPFADVAHRVLHAPHSEMSEPAI